uniref:Retrovirus-related Pol polyprotein from transposon TNT 1-94 n=1 Tax=Cajanus cajan TaxID=3821 RepID=A0A151SHQ0_CAJCA|nr:hypothetical protein KK1_000553 [Cajanus cajan]
MANDNFSSISNPHEPSKPFICITLSSVTKLFPFNYLTWKLQVEAFLDGYDLLKYPDGSFPAPATTVSTTLEPPVTTPNPAYQTWCRQDRLIYGALLTTLSPEVASLMSQTTLQEKYKFPTDNFRWIQVRRKKKFSDRKFPMDQNPSENVYF